MLSVEQECCSLEQKAEIIKYIEELIIENKSVTCKWLSWFCGISRRAAVAVLEELAVQNGTPRPDIDTVHVLSGALTSGGNGVSVILGRDLSHTKARFADNCQQFLYGVHKKELISDPVHLFRIQNLPDLTESFSWPIDATCREHLQPDEVLRALETECVVCKVLCCDRPIDATCREHLQPDEVLRALETECVVCKVLCCDRPIDATCREHLQPDEVLRALETECVVCKVLCCDRPIDATCREHLQPDEVLRALETECVVCKVLCCDRPIDATCREHLQPDEVLRALETECVVCKVLCCDRPIDATCREHLQPDEVLRALETECVVCKVLCCDRPIDATCREHLQPDEVLRALETECVVCKVLCCDRPIDATCREHLQPDEVLRALETECVVCKVLCCDRPIDATCREHLQPDEVLRALETDVMQLFVGVKQPEEQPAIPSTRESEALHEGETESATSRPLPVPETRPHVAAADSVVKNKSRKQRLLRATSKSSNSRGAGRCDAAAPPSKKMKRIIEFSESEESESEESHKEEEPEAREPSPVSVELGRTFVKSLTSLTSAADDGFIVTKKIVGLEERSLDDKPQAPGNVGETAVEGVPSSKKSVVKLKQSSLKDFFRK
ncbi:uncharacterized protein LOC134542633 [Bacillus rossius redtenbacheri]|uniref:uncharacterized protein LOC134542633 n=1 Tax=Bacillus rossius redtenbacheri TaxID=93214 RepID=UPI002FDD9DF3